MKITFILPAVNLTGGVRVVATYADRLRKRGHEVAVISVSSPIPTPGQQLRSILKGEGWIPWNKHSPSHLDSVKVPHYVLDSPGPLTNADVPDADVVIATWWETAEWVANLSESKGAKVYFVQHHEVFDYFPLERVKATYSMPLHKITVSSWLFKLMQTEYQDSNVSLVPNSVDTQLFHALPRTKQPQPTVGFVNSLTAWKRCDMSLNAFVRAAEKIPNLRLLTFGIRAPVIDFPLPRNAQHIHHFAQASIQNVYQQCDAWLFSSRYEGFGLPILEAMASRTPVIGTPAGAAPELLADGAGILVDFDDVEAMAAAILKICNMPEKEWLTMSQIAYDKAKHYTWDDATDLFEAALSVAIQRRKQGAFYSSRIH
jgi:glycosyltransferase involved in cell wall biosynthesis